ncbi:MAG: DUF4034 domain-containing protein, partial [Thermodesulfobacteriota bacterium]
MDVYCKRCKKVLGTIADEKIPPNVKRYAACRTCNEKILLFRKVETSPPLEGDEERKKRQAAAATSSTAAYPQKDAAPSAPRKVSGQTHRTVTIQPLPPSTGLSRNGSGKASIPFPPQIDDQGIKKADLWTVTAMGAAVILLIVFARPQFDPSRFFPVGTAYEVPTATENLPVSREPKETITVARIVELRQMLLAQQFEQLNAVLEEYQKNFEADQTDEYSVYDAYRVFFNTDSSFEKPLKAWKNHSPDKYQPYLAIAQYYYAMGWESRGNEWSRDTSEEQFEGMESYFSKAEENLKVALEINPKVMPAYRLLIGIYNATANGTAEDIMINKGLELFPHSFLIRSISSWANEPRWGGSYAMMAEIAKDAERYAEINPKLTSLYGLIYYDQGRILYRQEK